VEVNERLHVSYAIDNPMIDDMVHAMKDGLGDTPEFGVMAKKVGLNGAILGVLLILIIVLMVLKPGD